MTVGVFLAVFLVASGAKPFTLFFPEFERQGISMSTISFISIFSTAAIYVSGLYVGKLIEKYGVRKVMSAERCLMAAAYFLFGTGKIGLIFVGFVFLGTATTLCVYTPASLAISEWYRKRGLAISAIFTGMTPGASLYSYLCASCLQSLAWALRVPPLLLS